MVTITKDDQILGPFLESIVNTGRLIFISRINGATVSGIVTGHSRGGYVINGEMIKERVQVLTEDESELHSIEIENISSISIPDLPEEDDKK